VLTGRSPELRRCDELLAAALDGRSARLLVVGDPGIGKSALLESVRRRASRRGLAVIAASGIEGADDQPYALVDDLLRAAAAPLPPGAAGIATRGAALLEALVSLTSAGPVLLVVDDLQFADPMSMAAIGLAASRGADLPVATVVASRPDPEVSRRLAAWPRLSLPPLDLDASVAVLRAALGPRRTGPVLRELASALQGNPLALLEAAYQLDDDQLAGRSPLPDPLPVGPALHQAWGKRMATLSQPAQLALVDVAVAGGDRQLLAALVADAGDHDDVYDSCVRSRLLRLDPLIGPEFAHPLIRAVVLSRAPARLVRSRHRLAGQVAQDLSRPPSTVVHHLVRSVVGVDESVAARLAEQAVRAEQLERYEEAVSAWEAAARLSPLSADQVERAMRGVQTLATYGVTLRSSTSLLAMLSETGWALAPADRCAVEWVRASQQSELDPAAGLAGLWRAADLAESAAPVLLVDVLWDVATTAWQQGDAQAGLRAARLAAQHVQAAPDQLNPLDPAWVGTALMAAGLFQVGEVAAAVRLRAQAVEAAAQVDPSDIDLVTLLAIVFLDDLLLDASEPAEQRLHIAEARVGVESQPLACLTGMQAWRARARGDWATAQSLVDEGRLLADATGACASLCGLGALAVDLAALCADQPTVQAQTAQVQPLIAALHDRRRQAIVDRALGLRHLLDGHMEAALASLLAAADVGFLGRGLRDGVLPARVDVIELLSRLGDRAAAVARADDVRPLLLAMDDPLAEALAARAQAFVEPESATADSWFARAVSAHERAGEPFEHARTLLLRGEALRRARRRTRARTALADAAARFARLGARPWQARAEQELRAAGGSAALPSRGSPEPTALTAQERSVAEAVAEGRTNREVADLLYLSPRTVESHLSSAYRKLGVHGRGGLAHQINTVGSRAG
jgi:DNA-binding CsgD family transcriptional regulator/tetratricopeptide (TPR) repeat protein